MAHVKDILQLDLNEDIKNVIDLEDQSENEIQSEIESYIVTEGIGKHLNDFVNLYQSNIKETGVWISGFYGSGKSYFGKMLGYILANKSINGTPARDRFIPRLSGIKNASLVENEIRGLNAYNNQVVFLDIAKQNTKNGLAFTLFTNFLQSQGFLPHLYGYIEYTLFLEDELTEFKETVQSVTGKPWEECRKSNRLLTAAVRKALTASKYSEAGYQELLDFFNNTIDNFSPNKLKEELQKYLKKFPDENIVFIFDEASEAISQGKINLLELEGVSEVLSNSATGNKIWTIAIAQEKLTDVITKSNVSKSQLIKVTDRFKTKIHLESTEVDIIIRNRILLKKKSYYDNLVDYFNSNEGLIADATNLNSTFPTKTENADDFATYYPFHQYQFKLLQNFLFSSNALVANQIAARGMIITTFDVLRKQLKNNQLYSFSTAFNLCTEAQTSPDASLVNKYDNASKIIKNKGLSIDGRAVLKTIHFLSESQLAATTTENITKTFIADTKSYYDIKPQIEEALDLLVDAKILLPPANNKYKITSDLEAKLLEDMAEHKVESYTLKRDLVSEYLKKNSLLKSIHSITEDTQTYSFNILTDQEDEIYSSSNKYIKLTVYSLFSIMGDRQVFIEDLKIETQYNKDNIYLVPDNSKYKEIFKLMTEINQFTFIEDKYRNADADARKIVRDFTTIKEEKTSHLLTLINEAYANGSLIYLFDETFLNKDTFKSAITEVEKKVIRNIYHKRLPKQLSEKTGQQILKEKDKKKLYTYFSGDDFKFFDKNGNFIGDNLKVVEEITSKIKKHYVDGKSLETDLIIPPTGYNYGTVSTTLAALFRAGKLVAKFNGAEFFSYQDDGAMEIFRTGKNFQKASFKAISKSLTTSQKDDIVQVLRDLKYKEEIGQAIDWNTNDFELIDGTRNLAEHFIKSINTLRKAGENFDSLFPNMTEASATLQRFTGKTTEANYIDKADFFLQYREDYRKAIKAIVKTQTFIRRNLGKVIGFKRFVLQVNDELEKAGIKDTSFSTYQEQFNDIYKTSIVENFARLREVAQSIKDLYFQLMKEENAKMTDQHQKLKIQANGVLSNINKYPKELNLINRKKTEDIIRYADRRINPTIKLEYHIACQNCGFTLYEMQSCNQVVGIKENELILIESNIITEVPLPPATTSATLASNGSDDSTSTATKPSPTKLPTKITFRLPKRVMTVKEYRAILAQQLQALAGIANDDKLEINVEE